MYIFPDINKWFDVLEYREHNACTLLEINMKRGLSADEIDEFCLEFAKYICSVRCVNEKLYYEMIDAIKGRKSLGALSKQMLRGAFYNGFIRDEEYSKTHDYKKSFDDDGIKGYLGESLYYLIRNDGVVDTKIAIEPRKPKAVCKTSGIDFLEVRKDTVGFYFVVGEVKTSSNGFSTRNDEVIKAFLTRLDKNFSEIYGSLKDQDDGTDPDYSIFLETMIDIFFSFKGDTRKRLAGVFNYQYSGRSVRADAFSSWKNQKFEIEDNPICRRIKLVGIYNIDTVIENVRDILWNVL